MYVLREQTESLTSDADERRERALSAAVEAGLERSRAVREEVDAALEAMRRSIDEVQVAHLEDEDEARKVAKLFREVFEDAVGRIDALFADQQERLSSFNVVLFGRTGAGKSSVITALVRGDGRGISPGRTDYTDQVLDLRWRDDLLRVKDTPGTQGPRAAELAKVARQEVQLADVVLLAFDDDSQLRGEFREVARHVRDLGKPAIAILNMKNHAWGRADRCEDPAEQRELAKASRDHAGHIRDCLAADGLTGIPVVAINAQRAVYALAADDYRGASDEDAARCQRRRTKFGRAQLLEWSNFEPLERLLDTLASENPAELRTAMLSQQATAQLEQTASATAKLSDDAQALARALEDSLEQLLRLTGHPTDFRPPAKREEREGLEQLQLVLKELERARGGGFGVGGTSELEINARHYVSAQLGAVEQTARARASAAVAEAMRSGRKLTEREFEQRVLRKSEVESANKRAADLLASYMQTRVDAIVTELRAEMQELSMAGVGVEGDAGRAADRLAVGLSAAEIGAPLVALGVAFAFGPAGWAAAALAAGSFFVTWAAGKLSKLFGRRVKRQRESEITRATSESERKVSDVFSKARGEIVNAFVDAGREQLIAKELQLAAAARTLRQVTLAAEESEAALRQASRAIPAAPRPAQTLVRRAIATVERQVGVKSSSLWLYERWLATPPGSGDESQTRQAVLPPARPPRSFGRRISAEQADVWVSSSSEVLRADSATTGLLDQLTLKPNAAPTIVVVGNYSTGKTSFLRRLHWELGLPAPRSLRVGADPKTDRVRRYPLGEIELLDTPGHQSEHDAHTGLAREAVLGAAAVLHLFGPSLLTGSPDDVDLLLGSLEPQARLRLLKRTYWVINQIDDLSADPVDDPEDFLAAVKAKRAELKRQLDARPALAAIGAGVDLRRILCVSSDPYAVLSTHQNVSKERLSKHASWDGMRALAGFLQDLAPRLREQAVPLSRVEKGIHVLWERGGALTAAERAERARAMQLEVLAQAIDGQVRSGEALAATLQQDARRIARDRIGSLINDLSDPDLREERTKFLEAWWEDKLLHQRLASWQKRVTDDVRTWQMGTQSRLSAIVDSANFQAAWAHQGRKTRFPGSKSNAASGLKTANKAAKEGSSALRGVDRKIVLDVGHKLGHKFRPWEAKKLADRFASASKLAGRVALVTALLGAAWDVWNFAKDRKTAKIAEEDFHRALQDLLADADVWVDEALRGSDAEPGILAAVDADLVGLRDLAQEQRDHALRVAADATDLERRAAAHRSAIDAGLVLLRRPKSTVGPWN